MRAFRISSLLTALAAIALPLTMGCQPAVDDDDGADPEVLLEAFEAAIEAVSTEAEAHQGRVDAAADAAAVMEEEEAWHESAHELFEGAVHAAADVSGCTGMEVHDDEPSAADMHEMYEELEVSFAAHHDAMEAADEADLATVEQAFQDEVAEHHGHGMAVHDEMHEHHEAGEITCPAEEHEEDDHED